MQRALFLKQYLALQSTYHTFVLFNARYYVEAQDFTFSPHSFFTMNRSLSFAQSAVATSSFIARIAAPAPYLRALVLAGLGMLGSMGAASAQNISSVETKQGDAQALYLTVNNPALQRMQIQVVSLDNHTRIINQVNHEASYGMQLHFKGMPAGPYAVLLRVGRERYRYNVQVADQTQTTISVSEAVPAKPLAAVTTR
jgi:hypothetical protein